VLPSDENPLHSANDPAAWEAPELKVETLVAYDNAQLKLKAFEATEAEVPVQFDWDLAIVQDAPADMTAVQMEKIVSNLSEECWILYNYMRTFLY
jgi:hypothetical protein